MLSRWERAARAGGAVHIGIQNGERTRRHVPGHVAGRRLDTKLGPTCNPLVGGFSRHASIAWRPNQRQFRRRDVVVPDVADSGKAYERPVWGRR
jgi:hypothetical protein